ncbi:hypothetical protein BH09SUM1_BH09SUM1_10800 [soil metagenome]
MRETLIVLNELEATGFIRRYAIGGAMAAVFYVQPFETEDLGIMLLLPPIASELAPLSNIYAELERRGFQPDGPYIKVHGIPVQFLVAYNLLVEEAVEQAVEVPYADTEARVIGAEHLTAIMVDTGRYKDRARFEQMFREASLHKAKLSGIITRFGLSERYRQWTQP